MIEFFNLDDNKGTASFSSSYVTFNKNLLKYFSTAYRVRVGVDKEKSTVIFQLLDKDYALSGEVAQTSLLPVSLAKTYARVCSSQMIKYILDSFGLQISKDETKKFDAYYDEKTKDIVINIKKGEIL